MGSHFVDISCRDLSRQDSCQGCVYEYGDQLVLEHGLAFAVPPLLWNINYKMYYVFGAFNAAAFIHMFFTAYETKGYTLEEMDDVFDSGIPAWKTRTKTSRLEVLEKEIEQGNLKVVAPGARPIEEIK